MDVIYKFKRQTG